MKLYFLIDFNILFVTSDVSKYRAPNYAAVLALCTIGTKEAYDSIDRYYYTPCMQYTVLYLTSCTSIQYLDLVVFMNCRKAMHSFFLSLKHPSGGFRMHLYVYTYTLYTCTHYYLYKLYIYTMCIYVYIGMARLTPAAPTLYWLWLGYSTYCQRVSDVILHVM